MEVPSTRITRADLDAENYYKPSASLNVNGHIQMDAGLGTVRFRGDVKATHSIFAASGTGITAHRITAGQYINAGLGIRAAFGIRAGSGITAGSDIDAGWGITAGSEIDAGWGIRAGDGIKAGFGIRAGLQIYAQKTISSKMRIFAGVCAWKIPSPEEMTITAAHIDGVVAYGTVKLLAAEGPVLAPGEDAD